ncbi:MAG: ATP-binding cassette domain-containing protein, partial [Alphaproteobacteria bacterium]
AKVRALAGRYGFALDKADRKAGDLSGGEKARLLLALATHFGPHLLILDEPTNHLDVDSREALVHALNSYQGAVIIISHDWHLLETCVDRLWLVADGTVTPFDGDLADYRTMLLSERTGRNVEKKRTAANSKQEARREAARQRAELAPLKKRAQGYEKQMTKLTAHIEKLDAALADETLYTDDPAKAVALAKERGEARVKLEAAETAWLSAMEEYEMAKAEAG